ncbi:F-box family protein [Striga asiatica]|uniref:F-box family protein n=1 Tax=Striga asiatica TaxID=4170 RepID=A0A5A7PLD8_STRAF|nr:F-box family protein [Striga asiatica]
MMIGYEDNLLTEIFIWLPPKSLIRFKLVCKQWLSLISSDYFSRKHTLNNIHRSRTTDPSILLRLESNYFYLHEKKLTPYQFSLSLVEPTVSGFSNGLFLLQCSKTIKYPLDECFIYNPTTKKSRKIELNDNNRYKSVIGLNLVADPHNPSDYKIVCVRCTRRRSSSSWWRWWRFCQVEVYDSLDFSWKACGEPFWAPMDVDFNRGVYLYGCVHWHGLFFYLDGGFLGDHPNIELPNDNNGVEKFERSYLESCGYLHCVVHFVNSNNNSVIVFELESDFSGWLLKYSVDLGGIPSRVTVLGFVRGENEEEDCSLVFHEPGKVVAFGPRAKSRNELVDFRDEVFYEEGCLQFVSNFSFQFTGTLAPV